MPGAGCTVAEDAVQVRFQCVQQRRPVVALRAVESEEYGIAAAGCEIAVTDVVDEPGEAIDGHQVRAPRAGQKERRDREVLVCGLIEHGARLLPPVTRRPPSEEGATRLLVVSAHRGLPGAFRCRSEPVAIAVTSPVLHRQAKTSYFGHAAAGAAPDRAHIARSGEHCPTYTTCAVRYPYSLRRTSRPRPRGSRSLRKRSGQHPLRPNCSRIQWS